MRSATILKFRKAIIGKRSYTPAQLLQAAKRFPSPYSVHSQAKEYVSTTRNTLQILDLQVSHACRRHAVRFRGLLAVSGCYKPVSASEQCNFEASGLDRVLLSTMGFEPLSVLLSSVMLGLATIPSLKTLSPTVGDCITVSSAISLVATFEPRSQSNWSWKVPQGAEG